jgi:hypothetical protein
LKQSGQLAGGKVLPGGPSGAPEQLEIDNPSGKSSSITFLDIKNPGIDAFHYAIEGTVRYEHVQGTAYLEMWSHFAGGGAYFSRTLGETGPMQCLQGTSGWRSFVLPFFGDRRAGLPTRLVVNMVFAGPGTVFVGPLRIVQYRQGWWTEGTAALIGGIGGSLCGLLGATIGVMAGLGKARRFTLLLAAALAVFGGVSLAVGVVALLCGEPYGVYYPLLLGGTILAAVCGGNLPILRRRYQQIELRKMAAMDAG